MEVFFDVQSGLPRQGPGDDASTRRALALCAELPEAPQVLDIGCGPGAQTAVLASQLPAAHITAIDTHQPYLDQLESRLSADGAQARVDTLARDMAALEFEDHGFDLVWAEGSAYIMGFDNALQSWFPILAPGSYLGVSELVWLTDAPPQEAAEFFAEEYPAMRTIEPVCESIEAVGYRLVGRFTLPDSAWWNEYYTPLSRKLPELENRYRDDELACSVIDAVRRELDMRRRFGASYGYEFFVACK